MEGTIFNHPLLVSLDSLYPDNSDMKYSNMSLGSTIALAYIADGYRTQAKVRHIRIARQVYGCGLKEAKDYVELIYQQTEYYFKTI
jgi:hypothetical protein